jgi:hypothetical protein
MDRDREALRLDPQPLHARRHLLRRVVAPPTLQRLPVFKYPSTTSSAMMLAKLDFIQHRQIKFTNPNGMYSAPVNPRCLGKLTYRSVFIGSPTEITLVRWCRGRLCGRTLVPGPSDYYWWGSINE